MDRTITGTFTDRASAQRAVADVRSLGYDPSSIATTADEGGTYTVSVVPAAGDENNLSRILHSGIGADDDAAAVVAERGPDGDEDATVDALIAADDTGMVASEALSVRTEMGEMALPPDSNDPGSPRPS
jgi:hypothetical protein